MKLFKNHLFSPSYCLFQRSFSRSVKPGILWKPVYSLAWSCSRLMTRYNFILSTLFNPSPVVIGSHTYMKFAHGYVIHCFFSASQRARFRSNNNPHPMLLMKRSMPTSPSRICSPLTLIRIVLSGRFILCFKVNEISGKHLLARKFV